MCFYNNTIHIVEMFHDKNCQVYDVFTLLDSVYLYEDTVHIVKKIVLWQNKLSKVWCLKSFILDGW